MRQNLADVEWYRHRKWKIEVAPQKWWSEQSLDEDDLNEDGQHLTNHFGDAFKYYLKPYDGHSERYWPMVDEPAAYLQFCRLSRLVELGWDNTRVIEETVKFIEKYGQPWFFTHKPPFSPCVETPLTIDEILFESATLASVVNVYRLLIDINDDSTIPEKLKKYLKKLLQEENTTPDRFRGPPPYRLSTDKEVVSTAEGYIYDEVNAYLDGGGIGLQLSTGPFAPEYTFHTLLDAMWLQFYLEILNKGKLRECANTKCQSLFVVSRSDKEFCSKECGVKQYMREQYHARNKKEAKDERIYKKEG